MNNFTQMIRITVRMFSQFFIASKLFHLYFVGFTSHRLSTSEGGVTIKSTPCLRYHTGHSLSPDHYLMPGFEYLSLISTDQS